MDSIFSNSLGDVVPRSPQPTISPSGGIGALRSFMTDLKSGGVSNGYSPGLSSAPPGERSPIAQVSSRGDPVLSYEWEGFIIDPSNPEPIPSVYIESMQLPNIQFEMDHRYFHGRNLSYAAKILTDNLSIQLYNDRTGFAAALVSSWAEETFVTESGGFKLPIEYKKSVYVRVHDAKHRQVYSLMFNGCFPTSMGHSSAMDYRSSEPNSLVLNLSVDSVHIGA
jgi:hypothetical protein